MTEEEKDLKHLHVSVQEGREALSRLFTVVLASTCEVPKRAYYTKLRMAVERAIDLNFRKSP